MRWPEWSPRSGCSCGPSPARPDFPVADRNTFADRDLLAAAKGLYVIRDFTPGKSKHGYVITLGSSSTVNLVSVLPRLQEAGINVKVIAVISEELFDRQSEEYRRSVLPPEALYDLMIVSTGTRRMWPIRDVGPLTDAYSLTADWNNQWLTGGLEPRRPSMNPAATASSSGATSRAGANRFTTPGRGGAAAGAAGSDSASRSKARSRALWKRAAGSFSRQWPTIRRRAGGISPVSSSGGSSRRIAVIDSAGVAR